MPSASQQLLSLGATVEGSQTEFRVWAPATSPSRAIMLRSGDSGPAQLTVRLYPLNSGQSQDIPMSQDAAGYWHATAKAAPGDRYAYVIGDRVVPDPASRYLPEGVHGPTEIVDPTAFR